MTRHDVCERIRTELEDVFPRDQAFRDVSVADIDRLIEVVGDVLDEVRDQIAGVEEGMQAMEPMPDTITIGDKYTPAMAITEQADADAYFERCVEHSMLRFGKTRVEAEDIERANLGYFAGYYDHETRTRVEQLFRCAHPIFGSIAERGAPTPEEALAKGYEAGLLSKGGRLTPRGAGTE